MLVIAALAAPVARLTTIDTTVGAGWSPCWSTPAQAAILLLPAAVSIGPCALEMAALLSAVQRSAADRAISRLTLLCSTSHPDADRTSAPATSCSPLSVTGLMRVSGIECATLRLTSIFLPPPENILIAVSACAAVTMGSGGAETELAWRRGGGGGTLVASRLRIGTAVQRVSKRSRSERANAAALITGGMGGLGLRAASLLLSSERARDVLLASRSGRVARDGQGLTQSLNKLCLSAPSRVSVCACDIADADDAAHALRKLARVDAAGLHALHAAGLLHDMLIRNMSAASVTEVFAPKASGACHLHNATAAGILQRSLLVYSSEATALGIVGQGNYAAANAYLDALAGRRRLEGLIAHALQLPLILGAGMGAAAMAEGVVSEHALALTMDEYALCLCACLLPSMPPASEVGLASRCSALCARLSTSPCTETRFNEIERCEAVKVSEEAIKDGVTVAYSSAAPAAALLQRRVTGDDVLATVASYTSAKAKAETPLIDLELDSLALSALAADLSTAYHTSIQVASIIGARDCNDLATIANAGGGCVCLDGGVRETTTSYAQSGYIPASPKITTGAPPAPEDVLGLKHKCQMLGRCTKRDAFEARHPTSWRVFCMLVRLVALLVHGLLVMSLPALALCMLLLPGSFVSFHGMCLLEVIFCLLGLNNVAGLPAVALRGLQTQWQLFVFLLLGIILITTLTSVIFFVVSLLWMAMMHRFLAPPLHAGSEFEHWSWTWLWHATIIDTTRNLVPYSFKGTYLAAWACKLCGMHIGRDVVIDVGLDVLLAGPVVPSLVEIGDDVLIEDLALINNIECPDGMTYTVRPITIGHRATILLKGYVHPGTRVGDGATVGIMAFAQGDVPPNAVVRNSEVLDGQLRHTDPAVAAICTQTTLCNRGAAAANQRLATLTGQVALQLLIMFETIVPGAFSSTICLGLLRDIATRPVGGMIAWVVIALSVMICGTNTMRTAIALFAKWVTIGYRRPGPVELSTSQVLREWHARMAHSIHISGLWLRMFHYTGVQVLMDMAFGFTKFKWNNVLSPIMYTCDYELLELHDKAMIAAAVNFRTASVEHHMNGESGTAHFAPIILRSRSFVSPQSIILPGTILDEEAATGELSVAFSPPSAHVKITNGTVSGPPIPSGMGLVGVSGNLLRYNPDHNMYPAEHPALYDLIYMPVLLLLRLPIYLVQMPLVHAGVYVITAMLWLPRIPFVSSSKLAGMLTFVLGFRVLTGIVGPLLLDPIFAVL